MSILNIVMVATRSSNAKPRPGKRATNKERTKRNILRAALDLFRKKGFYRTTTRQIALKAKIAEGTLFNYFRTKEDLALFFFEEESNALMEWFTQQKKLQKSPLPEKLFALIHRHLECMEPYEDFIGAVHLRALQPASKLSPVSLQSQELSIRYLRFVRGILEEAELEEEIPPVGDLGAYAFSIFHMAMITYWLYDTSAGKEKTLATLDRALNLANSFLRKGGGWDW